MKSVKLIKSSSFDEIQSVIEEALKLGTDNNFGHDFIKDFEERYTITSRDPVSTGFERIDEICKGGLGKSELGVVIAPTGAGKSMVLVHLGSEALKQGKTVVHYTLELQDTVVGNRYDSCISGVPLADLFHNKQQVLYKIKDIPGQLIIKEYPTKSASTETIKQHIERLKKRGIEPDMIIVDYADLLRPVRSTAEKRFDLENTYEELRAIAQIYKCPVWTASQDKSFRSQCRSYHNGSNLRSIQQVFRCRLYLFFVSYCSRQASQQRSHVYCEEQKWSRWSYIPSFC